MTEQATPPEPPVQREDFDLTTRGAKADNPPPLLRESAETRSPAAMMRSMGFDPSGKHMTPLQFLVAVLNDEVDMIYRDEKKRNRAKGKGGLALNLRIECAKTAAKYMHMEQPKVSVTSRDEDDFGNKLAKSIQEGNERFVRKQMIVETVERISPDIPLPDASYPPVFTDGEKDNPNLKRPADIESVKVGDIELSPEGDTDYDPDRDD